MPNRTRNLILVLVGLAILAVLVVPRLKLTYTTERDTNQSQQQSQQNAQPSEQQKVEFTTTPNPADAYRQALADDKPMVVEFYADW